MQVTFLVRLVFVTFKVFNKRMKYEKTITNKSLNRILYSHLILTLGKYIYTVNIEILSK